VRRASRRVLLPANEPVMRSKRCVSMMLSCLGFVRPGRPRPLHAA
jgi:hypothetical protein